MKIMYKLSLFTALVISSNAYSESFTTTVTVDSLQADLTVTESVQLAFPTIVVDGTNNVNGATCSSWDGYTGDLCPGAVSGVDRIRGEYTITGTPNEAVTVTFDSSEVVAGLQVQAHPSFNTKNITLTGSGTKTVQGSYDLVLVDTTQLTDGNHVFNYTVTAVYQ